MKLRENHRLDRATQAPDCSCTGSATFVDVKNSELHISAHALSEFFKELQSFLQVASMDL